MRYMIKENGVEEYLGEVVYPEKPKRRVESVEEMADL